MSRTRYGSECFYCSTRSPRFATRAESDKWLQEHRAACTPTAKPAVDWGKVDALVARARKLKPLDPNMNRTVPARRGEPKRVDVDNWGRSLGGGVRWTGTNCLRASIANLLGAGDLNQVPDPTPLFAGPDWLDRYSDQLAEQTGYRLEEEPAVACLNVRNAGARWVAVIYEPDESANHAVVARGNLVYHDPAQSYEGELPRDRVLFGMRLVKKDAPRLDRWGSPLR